MPRLMSAPEWEVVCRRTWAAWLEDYRLANNGQRPTRDDLDWFWDRMREIRRHDIKMLRDWEKRQAERQAERQRLARANKKIGLACGHTGTVNKEAIKPPKQVIEFEHWDYK